jgi:hypothetical protein
VPRLAKDSPTRGGGREVSANQPRLRHGPNSNLAGDAIGWRG